MKIYTSGYAISGSGILILADLMKGINIAGDIFRLIPFADDMEYKDWADKTFEVKQFATGIYLEGEHIFSEIFLSELSLKTEGLLYLCYYENMSGYSCSYYLGGKKVLERLTFATGDIKNENVAGEFTGQATSEVIKTVFMQLVGSTLQDAVRDKGQLYFFRATE